MGKAIEIAGRDTMGLQSLRQQIENVDSQIVELLQRRAQLAEKIGDLSRDQDLGLPPWFEERETLRRVLRIGRGKLPRDELKGIYQKLLSACGRLLHPEPPVVACLGPAASFTHVAASRCFRDHARYELLSDVREVLDRLSAGKVQYGVVAIYNSVTGYHTETFDLLAKTLKESSGSDGEAALTICRETELRVQYCLLGTGAVEEIKAIHTHPDGLRQCKEHIDSLIHEHGLRNVRRVAESSTSEAARKAAADRTVAAVANRLAAKLWPLEVLKEPMEDDSTNTTRFLILGRDRPARTEKSRTLIWFAILNEAGALMGALRPVATEGLNMTLILLRPVRGEPGMQSIFLEFEGHVDDPEVQAALEEMRGSCVPGYPKILGSYPCDFALA